MHMNNNDWMLTAACFGNTIVVNGLKKIAYCFPASQSIEAKNPSNSIDSNHEVVKPFYH